MFQCKVLKPFGGRRKKKVSTDTCPWHSPASFVFRDFHKTKTKKKSRDICSTRRLNYYFLLCLDATEVHSDLTLSSLEQQQTSFHLLRHFFFFLSLNTTGSEAARISSVAICEFIITARKSVVECSPFPKYRQTSHVEAIR